MSTKLAYYLYCGYRQAKSKNRFIAFISTSSTFGIALGVAALIIALSVMNGFERELVKRLLAIVPHIEYLAVDRPIDDWQRKLTKLTDHSAVQAAAPLVLLNGMVEKGTVLHGIELRGIDVEQEQQVSDIAKYMLTGQWTDLTSHQHGVILGAGIAGKLGLSIGDRFQVVLPQKSHSLRLQSPQFRDLVLVGTFKMGGQLDHSLGYVSLEHGQRLANIHVQQVTGIRLHIKDVFKAELLSRQLAMQMTDTVYMVSWFRSQGHLYDDIQLVRFIMHLVLFIVIAVASFNIVSTLVMAVKEKQGDIAILKTMGASDASIILTFMLQGIGNGLKGIGYGMIFGILIAKHIPQIFKWLEALLQVQFLEDDVYFINFIPAELLWSDVAMSVGIALGTSMVATLYPAWRATKIEPAQVLGQV